MENLLKELEKWREARGITKAQMARVIGANSSQHYNNWVYRGSLPKEYYFKAQEVIKTLADDEYGKSKGLILGPSDFEGSNVAPVHANLRKLPVITFTRAGNWDDVMDSSAIEDASAWYLWPQEIGPRAYYLPNQGLGMFNPSTGEGYPNGCLLAIDPDATAKHGDDVVVELPDGQVVFKQLQESPEGDYLIAINPSWPDRISKKPEDAEICGVCEGYFVPKRR